MTFIHQWATDYIDHGYNVIPVLRRDKKPAIKWKEFQERRMTHLDADRIWGRHPEWNLAVVCGTFTRLVVVDADSETAVRFCKLHLEPTPMRVVSSKGMHFYYRHPGVHVKTRAPAHSTEAIDVRGDGGLCTGAGSTHKSGMVYRLDDGCDLVSVKDLPVYDMLWFPEPQAVMESKRFTLRDDDVTIVASRYLDKIQGVGAGARSNHTFKVAAIMVRDFGINPDQALSMMQNWNQRNDPPLCDQELKLIVDSAFTHGKHAIGSKIEHQRRDGGRQWQAR